MKKYKMPTVEEFLNKKVLLLFNLTLSNIHRNKIYKKYNNINSYIYIYIYIHIPL